MHRHVRRHRADRDERDDAGRSEAATAVAARASSPTDLATLFRIADGGTRRRLAGEVQAQQGNAGLVSLLNGGTRIHGLPAHVRPSYASELVAEVMSSIGGLFEADAEEGDEAELPIPTRSGTTIDVVDETFKVSGDFVTMANTMATLPEAGSVTSQLSDIYLLPLPGPVKLANVTVTETRSLPAWVDRGSPNDAQVGEWNRFKKAVDVHEQTHLDIDKRFFKDVHKKAIGVTEDVANARIDEVSDAADLANDEFDHDTRNGLDAGTDIDSTAGQGTTKVED